MSLSKSFLKTFSVVFIGLAMLMAPTTPAAFAGVEVGDGLTLNGSVSYRIEFDQDDNQDKDQNRERIRLRFGGAYSANDMVSMAFRLETAQGSLQSPYTTLGVGDTAKNSEFGLAQAFIVLQTGPATILLGKWGSPLFNPGEFVHDADINFEGIGAAIPAGPVTILLARHYITEQNWNDYDDDTILTLQLVAGGGDDITWKAAVGTNRVTLQSAGDAGLTGDSTEHNWNYVVAEVRAKDMNDLRLGGGYQVYDGDIEFADSEDESGFMVYVRAKLGSVGVRLYYWDVGYAGQFLFGGAAQDNFPYSTNFTGIHAQLDLPKILDAVTWDLSYYSQDTKNNSYEDGGAVMGGDHNRTRVQANFNVGF
jgi:hypothetical protein